MDMDEENVAQFTNVTGSTAERARQYLSLADGNIEQAVELFFTTGGIDLAEPTTTATNPPTTHTPPIHSEQTGTDDSRARSRSRHEVISIESDEEIIDNDDPVITGHISGQPLSAPRSANRTPASGTPPIPQQTRFEDDDEAMARRMQEEIYAGGDMGGVVGADGYRAPIGRTTETLVGPGSYDLDDHNDLQAAVDAQLRARQHARSRG